MTIKINGKEHFHLLWHSDQHTLHPHTPTPHILSNIDLIRKEAGIDTIDFEVWGGDLCHDITQTSDPNYIYLQWWVKKYTAECHNRKRVVRILAGTFSHDRNQPEMFEILKPKGSPYIKYVDKLSIEYIPEFNIHILYVPDNFGKKPKIEIYEEAVNLIAANNLKQVDFIFLHGAFDFQIPILDPSKHDLYDSSSWSKLAKKVILTGHVHKPSHKLNIYSSGSLDRIAHGEMHPKGAYNVFFNNERVECHFLENKKAMIYDTIQITPETTSKEIHNLLDRYLEKVPMKGASIRLKGGSGDIVRPIVEEYTKAYPQYHFDIANAVEKGVVVDDILYEPENYKGVVLDSNNLNGYLIDFIKKSKNKPTDIDYDYLDELLGELNSNVN